MAPRGTTSTVARGGDWASERFNWLRSVRGDATLSPIARLLAHELALTTWNSQTGQCNPGPAALAQRLGCGEKTVKRAMAELVAARCIHRGGSAGGKGKTASITFLSRAEIITLEPMQTGSEMTRLKDGTGSEMSRFAVEKQGQNCPGLTPQTGSDLSTKRGQICPPNHRIESYTRAGAPPREECQSSNSTHANGQDKVRALLAEKVRDGRYVTPSAVSVAMAQDMLRRGEVEAHQLRSAGIAF